ncbi:Kazal-type serine protease inhibitor family protein [Bacteriovorax sp. PP10]|uniref:Kazal-type serine protease inhibitor family protein n=1 Tax=Bacteriovorax antarcticus TaxID=3088717 RepID=A0ABU5VZ35_9BACT|nr:Kazal-type serine protease inhibitor family protein [Bacteriovorax sp. PP10]MEA9358312.1 Kazal-type serine protease inhibitor family protein [Bacteriovorax sp. PP10]
MKKLILCSLFVILTSCSAAPTATPVPSIEQNKVETESAKADAKPAQIVKGKAESCICAKLWMPVCGVNKKTYGNACEADCAGVKYTGGACAEMK